MEKERNGQERKGHERKEKTMKGKEEKRDRERETTGLHQRIQKNFSTIWGQFIMCF